MKNGKMYCLCLKNENLNTMKRLGYIPVGLGANKFSNEWVRKNVLRQSEDEMAEIDKQIKDETGCDPDDAKINPDLLDFQDTGE